MIETERLQMRPFEENDLDIIMDLYYDETIMKYMPSDIMNEEAVKKHLNKIICEWQDSPQTSFEMAVVSKQTQEKIGRARIHIDYEINEAMIGWLLLKKAWGKGYATEMTNNLINYCFDILHIHRVCALCHPANTGSWKAMEKCNMRREAHFIQKRKCINKNIVTWEDELEYAILNPACT